MTLTEKIKHHLETQTGDFNALALELFAYQYQHCIPYQRYCERLRKTPQDLTHWQEVPAVSTDVFREFDLSTQPPETARLIFHTSGTSQEKKGRHLYHDLGLYDAAIQASFLAGLGLPKDATALFRVLTPSFTEQPTSSLAYMFQKALEWYGEPASRFYFSQQTLNCAKLAADLADDVAEQRPVVLLGTAFSFVNFCDYLHNQGQSLSLPPQSRLLETGGLKGRVRSVTRTELTALFINSLGLDLALCFSEYGMTELSSQCYAAAGNAVFQAPHWMPVQILNPETGQEVAVGETGLVQFFDLANHSAPAAILTADLARKHSTGFELLGRAPKAVLRGCSTAFEPADLKHV